MWLWLFLCLFVCFVCDFDFILILYQLNITLCSPNLVHFAYHRGWHRLHFIQENCPRLVNENILTVAFWDEFLRNFQDHDQLGIYLGCCNFLHNRIYNFFGGCFYFLFDLFITLSDFVPLVRRFFELEYFLIVFLTSHVLEANCLSNCFESHFI